MKIKFWGCRGSIPVCDSRMIKYGGNTTCLEIASGKDILIIDAGTGIRKLGDSIIKKDINNIDLLITHSHWDHIIGFPFFMPIYSSKTKINIFGCTNSYKQLKDIFAAQMSYEFFPVNFKDLRSEINFVDACGSQYDIGSYKIKIITVNHPIFTIGFRIEKNNKSFIFITDNELHSEKPKTSMKEFVDFCKGATYLVHDAQFTEEEYKKRKGWGHSTFNQVIALAKDAEVNKVGFFHHDPNRRDDELEKIEKKLKILCKNNGYGFNLFTVKEMDEINL